MEPLSIVIDVENYKIGIDASPKTAVDYSIRQKLKRPAEMIGSMPKVIRLEPEKTVTIPEKPVERSYQRHSPEKISAFRRVAERNPKVPERKLTIPGSITTPYVVFGPVPSIVRSSVPVIRSVISHTAESLAQPSSVQIPKKAEEVEVKEKVEADTSSRSPEQGTSASSEMWRPW